MSVEEVFFSKVSGDFFLEIFEKSIDKHKIDAILECAVQSGRFPDGGLVLWWAFLCRRISRKNPAAIPIQGLRCDSLVVMRAYGVHRGTAEGHYSLLSRVFFEKC